MQFLAKTRKSGRSHFFEAPKPSRKGRLFVPQQQVLAKIKKAPQSVKGML